MTGGNNIAALCTAPRSVVPALSFQDISPLFFSSPKGRLVSQEWPDRSCQDIKPAGAAKGGKLEKLSKRKRTVVYFSSYFTFFFILSKVWLLTFIFRDCIPEQKRKKQPAGLIYFFLDYCPQIFADLRKKKERKLLREGFAELVRAEVELRATRPFNARSDVWETLQASSRNVQDTRAGDREASRLVVSLTLGRGGWLLRLFRKFRLHPSCARCCWTLETCHVWKKEGRKKGKKGRNKRRETSKETHSSPEEKETRSSRAPPEPGRTVQSVRWRWPKLLWCIFP